VVGGLATALSGVALVGVLWLAVPAVADGRLDGVLLAALALLALAAFEELMPLPESAQQLGGTIEAARRLDAITSRRAPVTDPERPLPAPAGDLLALEGVGVRPALDGPSLFDGADLRIARGRSVALVGPSGAGKTTIAEMLVRLRDPDTGRVTLDGMPLARYRLARCAGAGAYLPPRTTTCSPPPCAATCAWAAEATDADIAHGPRPRRAPPISSPVCRSGSTRRWARAATCSRAASAGVWGSPGRCSHGRGSHRDEPTAHLDPQSARASSTIC